MTAEGHLLFSIACAVFAKNAELTPVLAQGDWWHIVPSAVLTCLLPDIDHPKSWLGRRIPLVTELPPMRLPIAGNVLKKTTGRLKWYLIEVIPLFLIGTFLMYLLDRLGILPAIIEAGEPLVSGWLGLPKEASAAFVMGFLRRDFGATGLFMLADALSPVQAIVGMITITLFVPCFASLLMMIKERGLKTGLAMLAIIVPFAFLVGGLCNLVLTALW